MFFYSTINTHQITFVSISKSVLIQGSYLSSCTCLLFSWHDNPTVSASPRLTCVREIVKLWKQFRIPGIWIKKKMKQFFFKWDNISLHYEIFLSLMRHNCIALLNFFCSRFVCENDWDTKHPFGSFFLWTLHVYDDCVL